MKDGTAVVWDTSILRSGKKENSLSSAGLENEDQFLLMTAG